MVRITVQYPNGQGAKFDLDYYRGKHMQMVESKLRPMGLVRAEVDKGIGGAAPGSAAPYVAAGHLYFKSIEDFQKAFSAHSAEIMADIPNYTDIEPQFQISEIVS